MHYQLATFVADVTPPVGHPLHGGTVLKPVARMEDPLLAHGFVLLGDEQPIVLVAVDWIGIGKEAHDRRRTVLAEAAGTKFERVLVCALNQHDAPMADLEVERLIAAQKMDRKTLDPEFHEQAIGRVATALKASLPSARPITHLGTGQAKVEKVASNRRVLGEDGTVVLVRSSSMKDPKAKEALEGVIDPWLKTLSFWNGDQPLASLSVYATHPMTYYGQGNVSSDFAGLARKRRQDEDPGVFHSYATGCGGNIAAGKYNDGSPEMRGVLTERVYQAMKSAWASTEKHPVGKLSFRSLPLDLAPKNSDGFRMADLEAMVSDPALPLDERTRAAYALSWRKRCDAKRSLDVPVLDFGAAQIVLLPGEPFVEYQLYAQKLRPDSFVLVLGYGDYGPIYIPTDQAYREGGYEPGAWSFVAPGVETAMTKVLKAALTSP